MSDLSAEQESLLRRGVEEFNRQRFFACHETLEKLWMERSEPDRELIQGIIQIAVGYHHLAGGNRAGALKLLRRGLSRVASFVPDCLGLELSPLVAGVEKDLAAIEAEAGFTGKPSHVPIIQFIFRANDC